MVLSDSDFKTLLLIHLADCDYEFLPIEKKEIIKLSDELSFEKMLNLYNSRKAESFNYIMKEFSIRYETVEKRNNIIKEIVKIAEADTIINEFEQKFIDFFSELNIAC